jgi:hypothetical protein
MAEMQRKMTEDPEMAQVLNEMSEKLTQVCNHLCLA